MMCGGTGDAKEASEEVQQLCNLVKAALEEKANKTFETYTAKSYKTQVVAGTNYFIKIEVAAPPTSCVHVRVFKPLPHTEAGPELHSYQDGKTLEDSLEHF